MIQQIVTKDSVSGDLKVIEIGFDTTEAYKKVVTRQIQPKNSTGWFIFWRLVNSATSFHFNMPYNVRLYDWEVEEIENLGYGIKWDSKCCFYDITIYPANTNKKGAN